MLKVAYQFWQGIVRVKAYAHLAKFMLGINFPHSKSCRNRENQVVFLGGSEGATPLVKPRTVLEAHPTIMNAKLLDIRY